MLLQEFFASARLHRVHKIFFTEKCSTLFVPPKIKYYHRLIENHQYRQTLLSMIDFFFLFFPYDRRSVSIVSAIAILTSVLILI